MDPSPTQPPQPERRDHDSGRVAVPEIAELLHLQRPAAAVAAAAVVLFALLVTLVAPGVLPANVVTGLVVGVLALLAAGAAAVVLDGRDPILRGPRHLRRDGHAVLARMAGPDPVQHGGPVLAAIERRLEGREHFGLVLTGTGSDPSELAVTLGRAAAAAGHTALVIDLRAPGAPGVADVGEGTVRLGEAARLADDRPYAWIGAGVDRAAAARAAAGVARRPPRDLKLLLVVAPDAATHVPEVLQACDRTVLLVAADTQQRAMVTARLDALERAGGHPEAIVVGGLRVLSDDTAALDNGPMAESATAAAATAGPTTASEADEKPEPTVPPSPQPPPTVPESPDPEEPEPTTPSEPEPDAPPVQVPDPAAVSPDTTGDLAEAPPAVDAPHEVETPAADDEPTTYAADQDQVDEGPGEPRSSDGATQARAHRGDPLVDTGPLPPVFRTPARREAAASEPAASATSGASEPAASATSGASEASSAASGRSVSAPVGDTSVEGMAETDALLTMAALDQLVSERRERDAG